MVNEIDTVVVGAGHAGLSASYFLTKSNKPHLVLEKGKIANRWKNERWDSLTLLTPNWMTQLPGFHYKGDDPDGFVTRDEYIEYLESYSRSFNAPIRTETTVLKVTKPNDKFLIETDRGNILTNNIIVATGPFHEPKIPDFYKNISENIMQIHSSQYKNPKQLPEGLVLVIGSGNSGPQIVEDLVKDGRKVYLSLSNMRRAPRRYRGKDFIYWLIEMGKLDQTVDSLPSPEAKNIPPPLLSGVDHGHDLNPLKFVNDGVTLLGHLENIENNKLALSSDLKEKLQKAEDAYTGFIKAIDQYILEQNIDVPFEDVEIQQVPEELSEIQELDLNEANIKSIIWATGFNLDFSWINLDTFDEKGEPVHNKGVSKIPGLYFLGLRWLSKYKSFFIYGVGEDAEYITNLIA